MIENLPGEMWRDVKGFEGLYMVSNKARVLSLPKISGCRNKNPRPARIMKVFFTGRKEGQKYGRTQISKDGQYYTVKIHRLVANAFIPNPENKPFINHIDNNPMNNLPENIEWCTPKENSEHTARQNRIRGRSKLSESDIPYIRYFKGKLAYKDLGYMFNISNSAAGAICNRKSFTHIN